MKHILLTTFILFNVTLNAFTQDKETEAQFYYTQAETYYDQSKFVDAFNALVECEKILGRPNSKILYLRVKSFDKVLLDMEDNSTFDTAANMKLRKDIQVFFEITDVNKYPKEKYFEIIEIKKRIESVTPEQYLNAYKKTEEVNNFFKGLDGFCPGKNCLNKIFSYTSLQSDYNLREGLYQSLFPIAIPEYNDLSIYLDTLLSYFSLSAYANIGIDNMNNIESIRSTLCEYINQGQYQHNNIFNVFLEKYADLADDLNDEFIVIYIKSINSFFEFLDKKLRYNSFDRYYYKGMHRWYYFGKIFFKIQQRGYLDQLVSLCKPRYMSIPGAIKYYQKNK